MERLKDGKVELTENKEIKVKGTPMQIWKSPYMFLLIQKYYPENFAFLILRILELFTRKVREIFVYKHTEATEYVKKQANF